MGRWSKARDRVSKQVQREVKRIDEDINDELRRFRKRLAETDGQGNTANESCQPQGEVSETVVVAAQENPPAGFDQKVSVGPSAVFIPIDEKVKSLPVNWNPQGLKAGVGYIINHKTFEDEELLERIGSELDVKRVEEVLASFQLDTKTINDGTTSDISRLMTEVEDFNFKPYSCLVLVIMSHGYERDILAAKDGNYSLYKDVLYPILRNPTLVGKTKMLFVQSCKGLTDLTLATDSKAYFGQPTKTPDEILQFHSCVEGYVSYRSRTDGSFFIQILCDKLASLGDVEDIRNICNSVIGTVKEVIYDLQIPMLHTNLTKPFVFGHYKTQEISET